MPSLVVAVVDVCAVVADVFPPQLLGVELDLRDDLGREAAGFVGCLECFDAGLEVSESLASPRGSTPLGADV